MSEDSIQVGQDISRMVQEQEDTVQVAYRWNRIQVEQDTGGIGYRWNRIQMEQDTGGTGYRWDRIQRRHGRTG